MPSEMIDEFTYVDIFKHISGLFKYHRNAGSTLPVPMYDFGALPNFKGGLHTDKTIQLAAFST